MEREEIVEKCKATLKEYTSDKSKVDSLKDEDEIVKELGLDSLDLVEMVMSLEEKFKIDIAEEDIGKIKTFNDMVSHIDKLINQ